MRRKSLNVTGKNRGNGLRLMKYKSTTARVQIDYFEEGSSDQSPSNVETQLSNLFRVGRQDSKDLMH